MPADLVTYSLAVLSLLGERRPEEIADILEAAQEINEHLARKRNLTLAKPSAGEAA